MKRQVKKETSLLKKYLIKNRQLSLVYNKQVVYNVSRKYIYLYERGFLTMAFIDLMKAKAKQDKQTIVLPESKDKRWPGKPSWASVVKYRMVDASVFALI